MSLTGIETSLSNKIKKIIENRKCDNNQCSCRSKLVSQLTNGQLNSKCDDTKAYVVN